jgi:hypothetical protein
MRPDDYLTRLDTFDRRQKHCLRELRRIAAKVDGKPWVVARKPSEAHYRIATNNPNIAATFFLSLVWGRDARTWATRQR